MDHAAALVEQNRLLADLARTADPATPIPTCPRWTSRQLVTHVGRGDRWAAEILARGDRVDIRSVPDGRPPVDPDLAAGWLVDGAGLLIDAVSAAGPGSPVWTFVGPRPARWWVRRRLHEAVVHRADLALATGVPPVIAPEVAADALSEWLTLLAARPAAAGPAPLDEGVTLHLHATDEGLGAAGEWMIRGTGTGIGWEHGHGKGSAAVRGSATDLLLTVLRRVPADDRVQLLGDPGVVPGWLARSPF
jgi:uncharacterized protein (TIGR03083 family)